ncbi:hypothetical protein J4G48_0031725 [Bradyrhizobium barranii subsp. apii]|uniref:hypothetical protein n=1 Tax=Bradyrhizobium barranii TaxID=2992140 RepID=UPI001AA13B43|nr:hypothetical protein [Bradyrhizobium barranii]UPT93882.1 hypothetical protein J4G48_0031725 [Bradyrhizobium barranii subsp. apii]
MLWLVLIAFIGFMLVHFLIIRPILKTQPVLAPVFKAEATLWQQLQAKLVGFRTKMIARLFSIAAILVGLYDQVLPSLAGQDWTPLTAKLPGWALPVLLVSVNVIFEWLRKITDNPPHVIVQKDEQGAPMVVAIEPVAKA